MKPKIKNLKKIINTITLIIIIITNISIGKLIQNKKINLEQLANNTLTIIEKTNQKDNKKTQEKPKINEIPNNYLGYITIPNQNIKKLIKQGTEDYILNQNIVGLYNNGNNLDSKEGQIILAGHNNKDVFKNLSKLKINDEIKIITKEKTYTFKVTKIKIISINDYSNFNTYKKEKELVLITCMNSTTRLLVFAK